MNDEVYFWYAYEHQSLLKFDAIILVCVNRHAQSTQNKFAYLCNIPEKDGGWSWCFACRITQNNLIASLWVCITKHVKRTQNNKFTIHLQYLKENAKDDVDFLLADIRQRFLQSDAIILGVCGQACPNYPK